LARHTLATVDTRLRGTGVGASVGNRAETGIASLHETLWVAAIATARVAVVASLRGYTMTVATYSTGTAGP